MSTAEPTDVARLRAALASVAGEGQRPVDAERIFEAIHGRLDVKERQAIVDELTSSPDAAEAWRLAREMTPEPAIHGSAPTRSWRWLAVAAAAVVAVGVGWQVAGPWRRAPEPVYRGVDSRAITAALPASALLPRAQPVLRWTGVEGARYRVRVLTPDLQVLEASWESPTAEYRLSDETLQRIAPGSEILWQVEGRIPGDAVIVSPTFRVRVE